MRAYSIIAPALIGAGIALSLLNIVGMIVWPTEHPRLVANEIHKNDLIALSYEESIAKLKTHSNFPIEGRLTYITDIFSRRLRHYWPAAGEIDTQVFHGLHENWWLALRQHVEAILVKAGLAKVDIARLERRNYRAILRKGVGYCSQVSLALADYLEEIGLPALIVPLGGHVVAATSVGERTFVLDADYNAVFAVESDRPSDWSSAAEAAYVRVGYSAGKAAELAKLYTRSKARAAIDYKHYAAGWRRQLSLAATLSWTLPPLMFCGGWCMMRRLRRAAAEAATPTKRGEAT